MTIVAPLTWIVKLDPKPLKRVIHKMLNVLYVGMYVTEAMELKVIKLKSRNWIFCAILEFRETPACRIGPPLGSAFARRFQSQNR